MTARDRMIILVVALVAITGAAWFTAIKPRRQEASTLAGQIDTAQQRLDAAQVALQAARQAQKTYAGDYATIARLGKAVPADDDVPSLLVQLQSAARRADIDFRSVSVDAAAAAAAAASAPAPAAAPPASGAAPAASSSSGGSSSGAGTSTTSTTTTTPTTPSATPAPATGGSAAAPAATSAPATQSAAAGLPPGAAVGPAGFPTMPFNFSFTGSFFKLEDFLRAVDKFTTVEGQTGHRPRPPADHRRDLAVRGARRLPAHDGQGQGDRLPAALRRGADARGDPVGPGGEPRGHARVGHVLVHPDARARRGHHRSRAMSFLRNLLADLVEKRLWPVAAALVAALVAVPIMLGGGGGDASTAAPAAGAGAVAPPAADAPGRAQVALETSPASDGHDGRSRDPFVQRNAPKSTTAAKVGAGPFQQGRHGRRPVAEQHAAQRHRAARPAQPRPPRPATPRPSPRPRPRPIRTPTAWTSPSGRRAR